MQIREVVAFPLSKVRLGNKKKSKSLRNCHITHQKLTRVNLQTLAHKLRLYDHHRNYLRKALHPKDQIALTAPNHQTRNQGKRSDTIKIFNLIQN